MSTCKILRISYTHDPSLFEAVVYKSFCIAGLDYRAENDKHP